MKTLLKFASLFLLFAAMPLFAQTGAWRAVGSVGIIDESSLGLYAFNQFDLVELTRATTATNPKLHMISLE